MTTVGFIGAGNMGSALASAIAPADNTRVLVYDTDNARAEALAASIGASVASTAEMSSQCDYIFLAVKPNIIPTVAAQLDKLIPCRTSVALVSMAAGVEISSIEAALTSPLPIIRIMPNTPVGVGRGTVLWCANELVDERVASEFERIMKPTGLVDKIPERLIDAASAVSGCGPAFVFMFIEALADGGVKCGLPRDRALEYATETLIGSAELLKKTGKHPGELKDAVCSPGGSTIAGVSALERGAFRATAIDAVTSAYKRTLELGK